MKLKKVNKNNYAFIDSQNVNLAIIGQGWRLDWKKFRIYLLEKYHVNKAYLFIGYIPENKPLYDFLKKCGFELVYKPTVGGDRGSIKGNIDAELVLQAVDEINSYDKAILATGDGDFYCLIKYWKKKNKFLRIFVPNKFKYSVLIRQIVPLMGEITFMNDLRGFLEYKKPGGST